MRRLAANGNSNEATLIDEELETLFSRFQKSRVDMAERDSKTEKDGGGVGGVGMERGGSQGGLSHARWAEEEEKARGLRREEGKIRGLNRNGRVDYCIQE